MARLSNSSADYVAEMVRQEMLRRFGEETYTAGLPGRHVARLAVADRRDLFAANGLLEFTRRRGYKGPIEQLSSSSPRCSNAGCHRMARTDSANARSVRAGQPRGRAWYCASTKTTALDIVFKNGEAASIPWKGISWAKPYGSTGKRQGPHPKRSRCSDVGDVVYVMPTTGDYWALIDVPGSAGLRRFDRPVRRCSYERLPAALISRRASSIVRRQAFPPARIVFQTLYLFGGARARQHAGDRRRRFTGRHSLFGTRERLATDKLYRPVLWTDATARGAVRAR